MRGTGTTGFAYDHRGIPLTKRQTIGIGTANLAYAYAYAYAYDLADRVTQITYTSGRLASKRLHVTSSGANRSWLAYSYDANDNVGAIQDLVDSTKSVYYGYDVNDRMALVSQVASSTPPAETYAYTAGTNRLATLTTSAGARSISYDARGNTLSDTRPSPSRFPARPRSARRSFRVGGRWRTRREWRSAGSALPCS